MRNAQTTTARGMTRAQAAEYCGLSRDGYDVWVKRGIVPPPIAGTGRYDRKALGE
jgi:predicted site-specific integrase-resolvase